MAGLLDLIAARTPEESRQTLADLVRGPQNRLRGLLDSPVSFLTDALNDVVPTGQQAAEQLQRYQLPMSQDYAMGPSGYDNKLKDMALAGLTVFHGSPHKFDKFDLGKIGTGEGKTQQGVGGYLSETESIGQKYADRLADMHGKTSGYLYKIDLPDEALSKFANYDKPLSENPQSVQDAIRKLTTDDVMHNLRGYYGWEDVNSAPVAAIMGALDVTNGNARNITSEAFKKAGIPGIRYLDGGSRGAGSGTSNYVVFDDSLLKILERNGIPVP